MAVGALIFVAGLLKANSAAQAGRQQKEQAEFNAGVTAIQADEAADWAKYNEARLKTSQKFNRGQLLVNLSKNGVSLDEGTTGDLLLREQEFQDELQALAVRNEGLAQRAGLLNRAAAIRFGGSVAESVSKRKAVGQIVSSGTNAFLV